MNRLVSNLEECFKAWEFYTLKGNACYHRGELKPACKAFAKSVDLLEGCLDQYDLSQPELIRRFVLACHNTAHCYNKMNSVKEAEYFYSHAHFRLLSMLHSRRHSMFDVLLKELKITFKQLRIYLKGKQKHQLADSIHEESVRVVRSVYLDNADDVFAA